MGTAVDGAQRLAPYAPRHVRCLGIQDISGHTMKLYALQASGRTVSDALTAAAIDAVTTVLPGRVPDGLPPHRIGFVIIHAGEDANWLLVDQWVDGAIMCHRLLRASRDGADAAHFKPVSDSDLCFCVWEGAIIDFERRAFIATMMRAAPDPLAYFAAQLDGSL